MLTLLLIWHCTTPSVWWKSNRCYWFRVNDDLEYLDMECIIYHSIYNFV